jgi:hypothetical protein
MRRRAWPLSEDQLHELGALLQQNKAAAIQSDLYDQAFRAGQITVANLYGSWEKIAEPTEQEAEIMLELGFRHGHDFKTWIVSKPDKKTWTVGTSWKCPFKMKEHLRGEWLHGVVPRRTRKNRKEQLSLLYLSCRPSTARMMTTWNCCMCAASGAISASVRGWHGFLSKSLRREAKMGWGYYAHGPGRAGRRLIGSVGQAVPGVVDR